MPVDEQLRTRLAAGTEHLRPDLDLELARTLRRAHRRRQVRSAGALVLAAAVSGVAWLVGVPGADLARRPVEPVGTPHGVRTGATDMAGMYGRLEPGRYSVPAFGPTRGAGYPRALVDVPEGYFTNGGWVIDAGSSTDESDQWGDLGIWPVARVVADTCDGSRTTEVGPGVQDLADALVAQRGSSSTTPRPVTLGGHGGLYLEVSTQPDVDPRQCTNAELALWTATPEQVHAHSTAGVVNHLWILDVDGIRLVVTVSNYPGQPPAQHRELIEMAETIRFTDTPVS